MPICRANLKTVRLPLGLIVEMARRLARHEEYKLAESLLRCALAWDAGNPSAHRWLEFVLEAQNRFEEAYQIHVQKGIYSATRGLN